MRTPDQLMAFVPAPLRPLLERRKETVKFLIVGGTCYLITLVVNYLLKLTVLSAKPVTALVIATVVSTVVSYVLNREWSFRARGGRRVYYEATLFSVVNLIAVGINATPLWVARYWFDLSTPHVSRPVMEISDFLNGMVLGTALAMVFRLWAFKRWVFPELAEDGAPAGEGAGIPAGEGVGVPATATGVLDAAVLAAPANGNGAVAVNGAAAAVGLAGGNTVGLAGGNTVVRVNGSALGHDAPGPHRPGH